MHWYRILFIIIPYACISACSIQYEVCDINGVIYSIFKENYTDWVIFFQNPDNHEATIRFRSEGFNYGADLYSTTQNDLPIIILPTNTGIPASIIGRSGYVYTPESEFNMGGDDRYSVLQLEPHFYCYQRIR